MFQKKFLGGPISIPLYWSINGAHFYRYASSADLRTEKACRFGDSKAKSRNETKSSFYTDRYYHSNAAKVDMRSKYHNSESHGRFDDITFGQKRSGNSLTASDHGIDTSTAHSSWMQRSSSEFRQNVQDNSKDDNERYKRTASVPVERKETDFSVYQTSQSRERRYESDLFMFDRHAKTKGEMSKVENSIVGGTSVGHQEYKESIESASIANENNSKYFQWSEKMNRCPYCCSHNEAKQDMIMYSAPKKADTAVDSGCQTDGALELHQTSNIQGDVLQLEDGEINTKSYSRTDYKEIGWDHYSVKKLSPSILMSSGQQMDISKSNFGADSSSRKFEGQVITEKFGVIEKLGSNYLPDSRLQEEIQRRMQVKTGETKAYKSYQRAGERSGTMNRSLNSDTVVSNIKSIEKNESSDERKNGFLRIKITGGEKNSWKTETIFPENEKHSFGDVTTSTSEIHIDAGRTHLSNEKSDLTLSFSEEQEKTVWLQDENVSSKMMAMSSAEMGGYVVNSNNGMQQNSSGLFEIRTYWLPDEKDHKVRTLSDQQLSEEKQKHLGNDTNVTMKSIVTRMKPTHPSLPVQQTMSESKSEKTSAKISKSESNGIYEDREYSFADEMSKRVTFFTTEQPAEARERNSVYAKEDFAFTHQKQVKPIEIQSRVYGVEETTTAMIPVTYGTHEASSKLYKHGGLVNRYYDRNYKANGTERSGMEGASSSGGIYKTVEWKSFQKENNNQHISKEAPLDGKTESVHSTKTKWKSD